MKNIMKIMFVALTSLSLISSASAGELTVTGTAKATYNILSGHSNLSKGLGIANEIDFGATGETDGGLTWKYQVQFDPGNTAASTGGSNGQVDDTRLEITSASFGTVGLYVSEGGLDTDNAASQSVYGRPTDIGLSSGIMDGPGIDGFTNVQYHLPAGLLPFATSLKAAYAPGQDGEMNSSNAKGVVNDGVGTSVEQYQIKTTPYEGLNIGADYYTEGGVNNSIKPLVQKYEAGSVYGTYSFDAFSVGISKTLVAPLIQGTSATATVISNNSAAGKNANAVRQVTNNKASLAYNVNDNLSVSYEIEKSKRELIVNESAPESIKAQAVQAAYTMGGMTLAVSHGDTDNVGYVKDADVKQTLFAVTLAF
jgi:hypothetical protein